MPKKRRGTRLFASARAAAGTIASRKGKPSRTPVPFRKCRRERAPWVEKLTVFITSLAPEEIAGDDAVDKRSYPISARCGTVQNPFHFRPVAEPYRRACRVC